MSNNLWFIGVLIYIAGTFGQSLGANLQRLGNSLAERDAKRADGTGDPEDEEDEQEQSPEERQKYLARLQYGGITCFVGAGISMSMALFFASPTVLAPMLMLLLIFTFILANYLNGEPFNWKTDGVTSAFVVAGVTACVVSAPTGEDSYEKSELLDMTKHFTFFVCLCLVLGFVAATVFMRRKLLRDCEGEPSRLGTTQMCMLSMSYGGLMGCLGGTCVSLTKFLFSVMQAGWNDDTFVGVLSDPLVYIVAPILVATYVLQMVSAVHGFESASVVIVMSTNAVSEQLFATLGGVLWFQNYNDFGAWKLPVFIAGQVVAILAVVALTYWRTSAEGQAKAAAGAGEGEIPDLERSYTCRLEEKFLGLEEGEGQAAEPAPLMTTSSRRLLSPPFVARKPRKSTHVGSRASMGLVASPSVLALQSIRGLLSSKKQLNATSVGYRAPALPEELTQPLPSTYGNYDDAISEL